MGTSCCLPCYSGLGAGQDRADWLGNAGLFSSSMQQAGDDEHVPAGGGAPLLRAPE